MLGEGKLAVFWFRLTLNGMELTSCKIANCTKSSGGFSCFLKRNLWSVSSGPC